MRKPHYWKGAGRSAAPSNVVVFDCETWFGDRAEVQGGELQTFRLAVAYAFRMEKGRRSRERWLMTKQPDDIRQLILSRLDNKRPLWVIGHNLPYDLGAARLWDMITSPGYLVEKAAITNGIFWLKGVFAGKPLVFADTLNYLTSSLASIGEVLGIRKMPMPDQSACDDEWFAYCKRDVEVTAAAIESVVSFVRTNDLGPWQPTKTGLSFSAFRHRFMTHKVLVHDDRDVLDLERRAYYGGIVDTAFVGRTNVGPVTELDVCSMYPSVCRYDLPTKLRGNTHRAGLNVVKRLMESYIVVADVTIDTKSHTYPTRHKDRVYHPVGRYRTTLADPELRLAVERGDVVSVHHVAWYERGTIFGDFMTWMVSQKEAYKLAGNDVFSLMCKLMANGLYGKCGQRSPRWRDWSEETLGELEGNHGLPPGSLTRYAEWSPQMTTCEESIGIPDLGLTLDVRDYWGSVEVCVGHGEARDSCPAIAACVTSYARCLLRDYQRTAGDRQWVYSDTDSVWVTRDGHARLRDGGHIRPGVLGMLDEKGTYDWMTIHGPKDYATPAGVKLKGVKRNAVAVGDGVFSQLQFPSAMSQLSRPNKAGVFVRRVVKHLARTVDRVIVGADGWTRPLIFPSEIP